MADLPELLKSRVERAGWIPIEFINKGGGAKVYLCANTEVITSVHKLMRRGGTVSDPLTDLREIGYVLKILSNGLVRKKNALAALKVPLDPENPTAFARLKREIEAMRVVQHPSLIRLLGVDDKDPPEWFAMEWHPNGNLSNFIPHYKGQIVETIKAILPIVEALTAVHEKGFVHRDIKPSNIFVSDQGHLVLGDLGIAFPTQLEGERLTEPSTSLISRDWIPDWARFTDTPPQPKVDVFMLAKVIYFMVTGGQNVLATQLDDELFDLRHRLKDVDGAADLQELLLDCITTKESQCQFANAGELFIRLRDLLSQLTGNISSHLLINFLSVHSSTDVVIRRPPISFNQRYPALHRLQVFIPNNCKTFRMRLRIVGPVQSAPLLLFFQIDGRHLTSVDGSPIVTNPSEGRGIWVDEVRVNLTVPIRRGWHNLDVTVTSETDGHFLTGLMLYGE